MSRKKLVEADALWGHSVIIAHNLVLSDPERYSAKLALSLNCHALCLLAQDRVDEACAAKQEAVHIVTDLCGRYPARYLPTLTELLRSLSGYLRKAKRTEEARGAAQNAVIYLKRLYAQDPSQYKAHYATALREYSTYTAPEHTNGNGNQESVVVAKESVALWRELCRHDPYKYEPELAESLYTLGVCMLHSGAEQAEQMGVISQAVALYRKFYLADADNYSYLLAISLQLLGICHVQGGEVQLAVTNGEEAINLLRYKCEGGAQQYLPALDAVIQTYEAHLALAGRQGIPHGPVTDMASPPPRVADPADKTKQLTLPYLRKFARKMSSRKSPHGQISEVLYKLFELWNTLPLEQFPSENLEQGVLQPVNPFDTFSAHIANSQTDTADAISGTYGRSSLPGAPTLASEDDNDGSLRLHASDEPSSETSAIRNSPIIMSEGTSLGVFPPRV